MTYLANIRHAEKEAREEEKQNMIKRLLVNGVDIHAVADAAEWTVEQVRQFAQKNQIFIPG